VGEITGIEWTDHTANFWWGCFKVSEGCKNCYAETLSSRYGKHIWGPASTTEREKTKGPWRDILKWDKQAKADGIRRKVFVQSMSDFFEDHPQLPEWRNAATEILEQLEWLDVQLLTKRPENILRMVPAYWRVNWPKHIWIGTSVENQNAADKRIPHLLEVDADVHFLSCEPLLEAVNLNEYWPDIDWIIAGGESGHGARPMHPKWVIDLADHCNDRGVKFFFKQWGEYVGGHGSKESYVYLQNGERLCGDKNTYEWGDGYVSQRVGKKRAGNLLFEVAYKEFPR